MLKEYIAYLKDNPKKLWFKRKLYGWGWTPVTWQGWVVVLAAIGLIVWDSYRIDAMSHSASDALRTISPHIVIILFILLGICWRKGEAPRWQWGIPKK